MMKKKYVRMMTNHEKFEALCRELDTELDGVRIPATAAAIVNGIRRVLLDLELEREEVK